MEALSGMAGLRFVAFSGMDNAGKSSQIESACAAFESAGRRTRVVWARGGYTPGMEALKRLLRRVRPSSMPRAGRSESRERSFSSGAVRKAWLFLAVLDLIALWGAGIRLWTWRGTVVVADRYLADTLLDFRLNFPAEDVTGWLVWRFLCAVAPSPDRYFVMVVPVEESMRRSSQKNEPYPDRPEVLARRLEEYERVAATGRAIRIDGGQPQHEVWAKIRQHLEGHA